MAHEIRENDRMFSVRERPWHGLGNVLEDYPTVEEAIIASGLNWKASLTKMQTINGLNVPNHNAVVREDTKEVLGVVGNRYQIYQNSEMWCFIKKFIEQTDLNLETAGSLKNGRTTWVLAKRGEFEIVKNDPIQEYFLFRNGFDGFSNISLLDTDIRVVCNNTLTMAMKGVKSGYSIRHTGSSQNRMKEAQDALIQTEKYQEKTRDCLTKLFKTSMTETKTKDFLNINIFPKKESPKVTSSIGLNINLGDREEVLVKQSKKETQRLNNIESVMELVETGAGTDIAGVKGNAYGVYNALTEWADHKKSIRVTEGRDEKEVRFENAFFGTASNFKKDAFNELIKLTS